MDVVHGSGVSELDVLLEITLLSGPVVTVRTRVGFLPGVSTYVKCQLDP